MMTLIFFLIQLLLIAIVYGLTCAEILQLPAEKKLTLQELQTIQPKDIVQCLAHLGKENLGEKEAGFLWKTIVNFYEGIPNIPDSVFMLLHWVTPAVSPEEYGNITFNSIDVIQNFGLDYNLNAEQLYAIADRVRQDFAGKEPEDYTYYDLTALRQILCAFNRSEIERIRPSAYREAALIIGKLQNCNPETLQGFATLAVQRKAFGSPDTWSDATLEILGVVAEYLPKGIVDNNKLGGQMPSI
ncbi:uncharacterized protein LOC126380741 [Pectinophora gossypiella]|uniref:uncharacterized protein LOC126380741 n=1 Tax=Pectinophora gossypiella TaxID=13191 RepID=UPI00214EE7C9|nr:uncharacterized protein LOC126380741 [Pectinophora gossypiella]